MKKLQIIGALLLALPNLSYGMDAKTATSCFLISTFAAAAKVAPVAQEISKATCSDRCCAIGLCCAATCCLFGDCCGNKHRRNNHWRTPGTLFPKNKK